MPACGCYCTNTMVDVNVNAPAEQAPAMAPPTRTNEQILPRSRWVPDTVRYDKTTESYNCQLDEQWFDLTKDTLRDALQITPVDNNNAFFSPSTPNVLIKIFNDLGYPKVVRTLSDVVTNDMFQPWRALTTIINLCLTGKTSGFERLRAPVLQILWGIVKRAHIDYGERMFTKLIIHHLQSKPKFHPRPEVSDPDSPAPKPDKATKPKATKQSKPLAPKAASVTKPAAAEVPKTTASRPPKPTPETTEPSKKDQSKKRKLVKESSELVDEFVDEGVLVNEPRFGDEEADLKKAVEESLKDVHTAHQGPLLSVVIREPESGKFQPLLKVHGKGKEKVGEEQAAQVLLNLQTPKKKRPADQYIFQRHSSAPTEPSGHDESYSLYAELGLIDSETESYKEVLGIDVGDQDEGQAGPNPGIQDEGQAGSNPGDAAVSQPQPSHVVHAGPNLEHMDVEENLKLLTEDQVRLKEPASSARTLSSLQNLDKEFSFTNQFLEEKSPEDEPEKTNTKSKCISELEQHMADLLPDNLALEERLDKLGSILYKLENLDIPHQVSKAVDEIVTDAVDWAIQAPLRDRFRDLPEADMKEILHHRMWETKSYEAHEDHKNMYEALEKSMDRDHSDHLLTDLAEARRKKKRRHESPKTPPGSPPHQPPPPPPPVGPFGTSGASGLSQLPPLPPPSSTNQSDQSKGTDALSSSKTASSAEYMAWTTIDTRIRPLVSSTPDDLNMDDD
ncbi:hypothetical protein Tco_1198975 [Tanacetum coccineum]